MRTFYNFDKQSVFFISSTSFSDGLNLISLFIPGSLNLIPWAVPDVLYIGPIDNLDADGVFYLFIFSIYWQSGSI